MQEEIHVLAYQENIHCTQIELVEEGKRREAVFGRVHAGIKLGELATNPSDQQRHTMTVFPLY